MLGTASIMQIASLRYSIKSSIITGLFSLSLAIALIIISLPLKSIAIFIAGAIFAGFGMGFTFAGATREIRIIAPPLKIGDTLANYYIIIYFGVGIPTVILGIMDSIVGFFNGILYYGIGFIVVSLTLILVIIRKNLEKDFEPLKNAH
jgi:MFS family permease